MAEPIPPGWNGEQFEAMREIIQQRLGCSEERAIQELQAIWVNLGAQRPHSPPQSPPPPPRPEPTPEPPSPPRSENSGERERTIRIADFQVGMAIDKEIEPIPSKYALDKVKAFEYVQLWYFTKDGFEDARTIPPSQHEGTFGLLKMDAGFALKQVKANGPSKKAVEDENLDWSQVCSAKHNILHATANWPQKYKVALASLFTNLEIKHSKGANPRTLVLYQAVVRRQWHAALRGEVAPFDPGTINSGLIDRLENQIRDHDIAELKKGEAEERERRRERGRGTRRERFPDRRRSSRSASPDAKSATHRFRRSSTSRKTPLSACPICLGRMPHKIRQCKASLLWDGVRKARCTRSDDGRIVDKAGRTLCNNWNQIVGCGDKSTRHVHECSGCGNSSHGAQNCNFAEKAQAEDTS